MKCPFCRAPMADIADTPGFPGHVWECNQCRRTWASERKMVLSTRPIPSGTIRRPCPKCGADLVRDLDDPNVWECLSCKGGASDRSPDADEDLYRFLLGVLEGLEWFPSTPRGFSCPSCGRLRKQGTDHEPDCGLASAISRLRSRLSGST